MYLIRRWFGRRQARTNDAIYREGDLIPCASCHQLLKVRYFPPGKILIGGPAARQGIALRCSACGFITCIDCAMKPTAGQAQACPSCRTILGPTILTEGVDVLERQLSVHA